MLLCLMLVAGSARGADVQNADGDTAEVLTKKATKMIKRGALADAETLLKQAIEISPKNSNTRLALAYLYFKKRRWVDAYNLSIAVAREEPKNAHALAVLGVSLLNAGRFTEAKTVLYNALLLNKHEACPRKGFVLIQ